ncbi:alpha/beta fold hydrolase [Streptomyces sp. NPDC020794]|uniref:alpha/beta fold hydrolase n=1 Tax=unclassified Streptomyces TaxID=2593676 RepID=UPI0036E0C0AD
MNLSSGPAPLPSPAANPASPLSAGTHTLSVRQGHRLVEQRYHVAGAGPVCIAHSGGPGIGWDYLRMAQLEQHLTMVYIEPVGTGDSGRLTDPRAYHLATYTHFLHALVEHLAVPRIALLGHSHGGFVAQRYALDHPEQVDSLILYDTSPVTGEDFWSTAVANLERFARRHAAAHPEVATYTAGLTTRLDLLTDDAASAVLRSIAPAYFFNYWGREEEFAPARRALRMYAAPSAGEGPPFDVRAELSGLAVPTLVVVGEGDFICGPHWAGMIQDAVPDARLVVLAETGHLGHVESPEEFTAAVVGFVVGTRGHTV